MGGGNPAMLNWMLLRNGLNKCAAVRNVPNSLTELCNKLLITHELNDVKVHSL